MSFISYLKDGISLGSIYAIIALGYTMVYGIAKMLNFAHGDVIMVGAFVILTAVTKASMSPILAIILSVVICTVAGVVIEAVAYRPLRKASSNLAVLITCNRCQLSASEPGAFNFLAQMQRALFRLSMFRLWSCLADSLRLKVLRS